jgi:hypothetical protein
MALLHELREIPQQELRIRIRESIRCKLKASIVAHPKDLFEYSFTHKARFECFRFTDSRLHHRGEAQHRPVMHFHRRDALAPTALHRTDRGWPGTDQ